MISHPSMMRRAFDFAAILAMIHLAVLLGLGGYLVGNGMLNKELLRQVVMLVHGEDPIVDQVKDNENTDLMIAGEKDEGETAFVASQTDMEILQLEASRIKTELDQRLALNNSILLRAMTEREAFKKERQSASQLDQQDNLKRDQVGFQKQIAIYESLAPKIAVQHLLNLDDMDEAARILLEMETRKAKKIIEAAKNLVQIHKMQQILQRVRDVVPTKFDELNSE